MSEWMPAICAGFRSPFRSWRQCRAFLLLSFTCLLGPSARSLKAQGYLENIGMPTFTTALPVENGFINAANGNLHIEIPLASYPQRGGRQFNVNLVYDSAIWRRISNSWQPTNISSSMGGWRLITSGDQGGKEYTVYQSSWCAAAEQGFGDYRYDNFGPFTWTAQDGTQRVFPILTRSNVYPEECSGDDISSDSQYATDGSGYRMDVVNWVSAAVYAPDGSRVYSTSTYRQRDMNGNYYILSSGNFVDTVGRAPVTTTVNCGGDSSKICYDVPNSQGGTSRYTVTTGPTNVSTSFGQSGVTEYSGTITIIQSMTLPDNTTYSFTYDNYGLLNSMKLPTMSTGTQISYSYTTFTDGYAKKYRWVYSRTTPDGYWIYSPQNISSCNSYQVNCQQKLVARTPTINDVVYTFALNGGAWPIKVEKYDGAVSSGIVLATTTQCFSFVTVTNGQCSYSIATASPAVNVHVITKTATLPTPSGNISTTSQYAWNTSNYGTLTQMKEWNFGVALTAPASRTTDITYVTVPNYLWMNIVNLPVNVWLKDSSGIIVARTIYTYDGSSLANAAGFPQHDDVTYGANNLIRGNVTQVQRLVSGSTYLTSTATYDMTGQVKTATDWKANLTTFIYTGCCYNAYPTTIRNALNHNTVYGYNLNAGLVTSITDPNSKTTSVTYDNLLRPLTSSFPDNGQTSVAYNLSSNVYVGSTATQKMTASTDLVSTENTDSLGRVISSVLVSDPQGQTTVDTVYDSHGRVLKVSDPYRSGETVYWEQYAYDRLDRVKQVTRTDGSIAYTYYGAAVSTNGGRSSQLCSGYGVGYPILYVDEAGKKQQTWTDAFGRIIEADEPDSSGSLTSGSALATCYSYDVKNNLTGVAQGGQTRTYVYDNLSRLTQKTEPESGTTYFYYTTTETGTTPCSGDPSLVCKRKDARNVTTTYGYDVLNRLVSRSHSDGTPTVAIGYDQTSLWGVTLTNYIGRVTSQSKAAPNYNSEIFSYDAVGRVIKNYKCAPINCGSGSFLLAPLQIGIGWQNG